MGNSSRVIEVTAFAGAGVPGAVVAWPGAVVVEAGAGAVVVAGTGVV